MPRLLSSPHWQAHNVLPPAVPLAATSVPPQRSGTHLATMSQLGHALAEADHDLSRILAALATALTSGLCDGCSVVMVPWASLATPLSRHRDDPRDALLAELTSLADPGVHAFESSDHARAAEPSYVPYIDRFGLSGLAVIPLSGRAHVRGIVIATRDGTSLPFDRDEVVAIETCVEFATLAAENALELEVARERASSFHRELVAIVGQDLRGPLEAILLGTEILAIDSTADPSGLTVVHRVVSFAHRLTRMIDQLLDVTRVRLGGGIPLARTSTRVVSLIRSMIGELGWSAPASRFELVAETDIEGNWDPDRLVQVMSSLLNNAIEHSPEGAMIQVHVDAERDSARISVTNQLRDDPVSPAALAELFEPHRGGSGGARASAGLGLGMYIAQEIISAHGGSVAAESSLAGTTLRVVLPTARA
ncbi:hypothetical protein BH11MYX3_BH11MYX3_27770 [soil metagenome]